jgi:hypothetical protein
MLRWYQSCSALFLVCSGNLTVSLHMETSRKHASLGEISTRCRAGGKSRIGNIYCCQVQATLWGVTLAEQATQYQDLPVVDIEKDALTLYVVGA